MDQHSEISKAYWAGLFDAEGSIAIDTPSRVVIRLGNSNLEVLNLLTTAYPGLLRYDGQTSKGGTYWEWICGKESSVKFLEDIHPFSYIKKEQIKLGLEFEAFHAQFYRKALTEKELMGHFSYVLRMKYLKSSEVNVDWIIPSSLKLHYLAGLFDGDGSFNPVGAHPVIELAQLKVKSWRLLDLPKEESGGTCRNEGNMYRWTLFGKPALVFLEFLLPYSIIRKRDIEVILNIYKIAPLVGSGHKNKTFNLKQNEI